MRRDVVFQPPLGREFCTDFIDQLLRRHQEIGVSKHPLLPGFGLELSCDGIKGILERCFGNALLLLPKFEKVLDVIEPSRHLFLRQVSLVHFIQDTDEQLFQILLHLGHVGARQTTGVGPVTRKNVVFFLCRDSMHPLEYCGPCRPMMFVLPSASVFRLPPFLTKEGHVNGDKRVVGFKPRCFLFDARP